MEAKIAQLEERLEFARNYVGIEARTCPLCTYKNGKFIKQCSLHGQINRWKEQWDIQREATEDARHLQEIAEKHIRRTAIQLQALAATFKDAHEIIHKWALDDKACFEGCRFANAIKQIAALLKDSPLNEREETNGPE